MYSIYSSGVYGIEHTLIPSSTVQCTVYIVHKCVVYILQEYTILNIPSYLPLLYSVQCPLFIAVLCIVHNKLYKLQEYGIEQFPTLVYFDKMIPNIYSGNLLDNQVNKWTAQFFNSILLIIVT